MAAQSKINRKNIAASKRINNLRARDYLYGFISNLFVKEMECDNEYEALEDFRSDPVFMGEYKLYQNLKKTQNEESNMRRKMLIKI